MILRLQSHSVFHRWEIPLWLLLVLSEILSVLLIAYPSDFLGEEQRRYGKTHRDWFSNGACIRCHCDKEGTLGHLILPLRIVAK